MTEQYPSLSTSDYISCGVVLWLCLYFINLFISIFLLKRLPQLESIRKLHLPDFERVIVRKAEEEILCGIVSCLYLTTDELPTIPNLFGRHKLQRGSPKQEVLASDWRMVKYHS